jgi:hypothetical protein
MAEDRTVRDDYAVHATVMVEALKVVAALIAQGRVRGLVIAATLDEGVVLGHHLVPAGDPYRLRGALAELDDVVRETYIKRPDGKEKPPTLFNSDGSSLQ